MSAAFLCVQFRNLLPSEELLLRARELWTDMHQRCGPVHGDATLSITSKSDDSEVFDVELRVPGALLSATAHGREALSAIRSVFEQLELAHAIEDSEVVSVAHKIATPGRS